LAQIFIWLGLPIKLAGCSMTLLRA